MVSSNKEALDQELLHIWRALQACLFPNWALNQLYIKFQRNNHPRQQNNHNSSPTNKSNNKNNKKRKITIVVPYIQGTSEKVKKICKAKDIQVHFKGTNTLRTILVISKDKDPKLNKSAIIYHFKCPQINCTEAFIGESGRAWGDRIKEHLKAPSPYISTAVPQDIPSAHNALTSYTKKHKVLPGTQRKPCSYM